MQLDTLSIRHNFNDKDLADMAREQADKLGRLAQKETEMVSVKKSYQAQIDELKAGVQGISVRINAGFEMRAVKCLMFKERPEGYIIAVRLDTGRIAKRRKLQSEERQIEITVVAPDPFIAIAVLPVDDPDWDTDLYQCPVTAREMDELKPLGVHFIDYDAPVAFIEG